MVNSQGGDICPKCRVALFRPPPQAFQRFVKHYYKQFGVMAQVIVLALQVLFLWGLARCAYTVMRWLPRIVGWVVWVLWRACGLHFF